MIVASGLSLKFQVVGYHKLLLIKPWALQLCRGFKEAYKQRRLHQKPMLIPKRGYNRNGKSTLKRAVAVLIKICFAFIGF